MDNDQNTFFKYWFSGLMEGFEQVDKNSQDIILRSCGLACAQSYTAQVFLEARQQSNDLDGFLSLLDKRFPEARYESINEQKIFVTINECGCDLVKLGWVKSSMLCECSVNNLQENFEKSLARPVQVVLKSSILGGAKKCCFEVLLADEDNQPMENGR